MNEKSSETKNQEEFLHLKISVIILTILLCITALGGIFCLYKLYKKESAINSTIETMNQSISKIDVRLDKVDPQLDDEVKIFLKKCNNKHYNILFLGNSITRHGYADYWWSNNRGMASSTIDKDYVHLTEKALSTKLRGGQRK